MSSVGKLVLKNTTGISLNDRFTQLRKAQTQQPSTSRQSPKSATLSRSPRGRPTPTAESLRQKQFVTQLASSKNKRLAQQMERRPTVAAALRLKKRSLGIAARSTSTGPRRSASATPRRTPVASVKTRLSLPAKSRRAGAIRGRLSFLSPAAKLRGSVRTRLGSKRPSRQQQATSPHRNAGVTPRRGGPKRKVARGRLHSSQSPRGNGIGMRSDEQFQTYQQTVVPQTPRVRGRGRGVRGRGRDRSETVHSPVHSAEFVRGGGVRGSAMRVRGGRGRGRGQNGRGRPLTREDLDKELDQYMSSTNAEEEDVTMV